MLCKELQYGDWCCDLHGFPMQITNVGEDYAYATFEGNEGDPWEFDDKDDRPEPIPLTEEILRANGFYWAGSGDSTMMLMTPYDEVNERYNIYVGLVKKTIEVFVAVPEYRIRDVRKTNKVSLECCGCYVHELQHALRLCGLYELADNLKV